MRTNLIILLAAAVLGFVIYDAFIGQTMIRTYF